MKISDIFFLSTRNIARYKQRSAKILLTISILFGIILFISILMRYLENNIILASYNSVDPEILIEVQNNKQDPQDSLLNKSINSQEDESLSKIQTSIDNSFETNIRKRINEYNGILIGHSWIFQLDYPYKIIDKKVVEKFIDKNLFSDIPDGKVPVIMPKGWQPPATPDDHALRDRIGDTLYRVGSFPDVGNNIHDNFNFSLSNFLTTQLPRKKHDSFLIIDDGSGAVEKYLMSQLEKYKLEGGYYENTTINKNAIISFKRPEDVIGFSKNGSKILTIDLYNNYDYSVDDLYGTTLQVSAQFNNQRAILLMIYLTCFIVAAIVFIITLKQIIIEDSSTIAQYKILGATTWQIIAIYFMHFLELCILSILIIFSASILLSTVVMLILNMSLSESLRDFYNLATQPKLRFFIESELYLPIILSILTIAPISIILCTRNFMKADKIGRVYES